MALASLDGLVFRLNPSSIQWNFQIKTNVEHTIGGRVVQVLGATLSDITITGEYGERMGLKGVKGKERGLITDPEQDPGSSWRLAEEFVRQIRAKMEKQSADAKQNEKMNPALLFEFPDYGWRFQVYIKAITSGTSDSAVDHTVGNFAYKYTLTLFIVQDLSDNVTRAGHPLQETKGPVQTFREKAIASYIARISEGVGWKKSEFNDPRLTRDAVTGELRYAPPDPATAEPEAQDGGDVVYVPPGT